LEQSCTNILFFKGTFTFDWNNGEKSTVDFENIDVVKGDATSTTTETGTVTDGFGKGDIATQVLVAPNLDVLACASEQGVTSIAGTATLTIA
jgi:hypothetical protein